MEYYFSTTLNESFDVAIDKTIEALKTEGFGVISDIDMQGKLKEKVGVDIQKYRILGACNPPAAYRALNCMLPFQAVSTECIIIFKN